jgi:hypothetical protein
MARCAVFLSYREQQSMDTIQQELADAIKEKNTATLDKVHWDQIYHSTFQTITQLGEGR